MTPSEIVRLDALPRTPNGKVDRGALPVPARESAPPDEAPLGGLEGKIAALWSEMLGRERVSAADNFFELGGHSLLAVQVLRRMRDEITPHVAVTDLYRFPTVRTLAAHLGQAAPSDSAREQGFERARARLAARRRGAAEDVRVEGTS